MLAFHYRFHGHGSLRYVYAKGQAFRSRLMTVKVVRNARRQYPRIAIVISKKVHKSAVGRNRMRRRLYELIRHELPRMTAVYDIAVIVSSAEVISISSDELHQQFTSLLAQAGLYDRPAK